MAGWGDRPSRARTGTISLSFTLSSQIVRQPMETRALPAADTFVAIVLPGVRNERVAIAEVRTAHRAWPCVHVRGEVVKSRLLNGRTRKLLAAGPRSASRGRHASRG